jgi:hypothetical protein
MVPIGERWGVIVILVIYVMVQLNNILHGVFIGQDFGLHEKFTQHLLANPSQWFIGNFTRRPLIFWIGEVCSKIGPAEFTYQRAALVVVMLSVVALGFVYASTRRFIGSSGIRLSALAFIAFLPVTIIAAVVYAEDTVALLPFAVCCWALGRALDGDSPKGRMGFAVVAGLALVVGQLARFMFLPMTAGVLLIVGLDWFLRRISSRDALTILCLAGVLPLAAGLAVHFQAKSAAQDMEETSQFEWRGTGEMTWRSLLLIKGSDGRILDAPTYWNFQYIDGKIRRSLIVPNNFSYPALLHLGIFTDISNLAPGGSNDARNPRPELQQIFSIISVRTGLFFSLWAVAATLLFVFQMARTLAYHEGLPPAGLCAWGVLAFAWFLPIVGSLPFVHHVYDWGYWLPRIILPALWGFSLLLFFHLDTLFGQRPLAKRCVELAVIAQCALQIASVWH